MKKISNLNFNLRFFLILFSISLFSSCRTFLGVEKINPQEQIKCSLHLLKINTIKSIGFLLIEDPTPLASPFYADSLYIHLIKEKIRILYHDALRAKLDQLKINIEQIALTENLSKFSENLDLSHIGLLSYKKDSVVLEIISIQEKKPVFKLEMIGPNQVREGHLIFGKVFYEVLSDPDYFEKKKKEKLQNSPGSQPVKTMI